MNYVKIHASPIEDVAWPVFIVWTLISVLLGAIIRELGGDLYQVSKSRFRLFMSNKKYSDQELIEKTQELIEDLEVFHTEIENKNIEQLLNEEQKEEFDDPIKDDETARWRAEYERRRLCNSIFLKKYYNRSAEIRDEYEIRGFEIEELNKELYDGINEAFSIAPRTISNITSELRRLSKEQEKEIIS